MGGTVRTVVRGATLLFNALVVAPQGLETVVGLPAAFMEAFALAARARARLPVPRLTGVNL